MNKKSPPFGPYIIGVLFGIVSGALFLMMGRILAGFSMWSVVALFLAYALPRQLSTRLLGVTIAAVIYSGAFAYFAASSEITGKAVYYHQIFSRGPRGEPVTRESSPIKFREATDYKWVASVACLGIGATAFLSRRKSGSISSSK